MVCALFPGNKKVSDNEPSGLIIRVYPEDRLIWNDLTDVALIPIRSVEQVTNDGTDQVSKALLNYKISSVRKCPSEMPVGSPVATVGFPAFGKKDIMTEYGNASSSSLIVSNGIVSGYDTTVTKPLGKLPHSNYYVSAKIDSGNSGGIAFSKDKNGLCVLGIPTWLNIGNYEAEGLVQNIENVMYKN